MLQQIPEQFPYALSCVRSWELYVLYLAIFRTGSNVSRHCGTGDNMRGSETSIVKPHPIHCILFHTSNSDDQANFYYTTIPKFTLFSHIHSLILPFKATLPSMLSKTYYATEIFHKSLLLIFVQGSLKK